MAGERERAVEGDRPFSVSHTQLDDGTSVVSVAGAIDVAVADSFESALGDAVHHVPNHGVIVDLTGVTFLDSTALTALVHSFEHQRARLERFSVVANDTRVRTILEITRLDELLHLTASREEAQSYVAGWR